MMEKNVNELRLLVKRVVMEELMRPREETVEEVNLSQEQASFDLKSVQDDNSV